MNYVTVDVSVWLHMLHSQLPAELTGEAYSRVVVAQLAHLVSCDWLGHIKPVEVRVIIACDSKNTQREYWRHGYLRRPDVVCTIPPEVKRKTRNTEGSNVPRTEPVHYKAGRKYPEYSFGKLKNNCINWMRANSFPVLGYPGYEADDVAALLVHELRPSDKMLLATIDTDWLGLVSERVHWFDIKGYSPRLRANIDDINAWAQRCTSLKTAAGRDGVPLFEQPSDIWGFKTRYGDKSDSLPAGSPREVIDLLNPPDEFRLWNNLRALCEAAEAMTPIGNTREFTDTHRKILYVSGVRPVIPIYEL